MTDTVFLTQVGNQAVLDLRPEPGARLLRPQVLELTAVRECRLVAFDGIPRLLYTNPVAG